MKLRQSIARFWVPRPMITLYYFWKFRCFVSMRAEVEMSRLLSLGAKTTIGSFTKIKATSGSVRIGRHTRVEHSCFIGGQVQIGDDCLIGPGVAIVGSTYRYDELETPFRVQGTTSLGVIISDNVVIGPRAVILDGCRIGRNVIISPNAVVAGAIPQDTVVRGNPARVISSGSD